MIIDQRQRNLGFWDGDHSLGVRYNLTTAIVGAIDVDQPMLGDTLVKARMGTRLIANPTNVSVVFVNTNLNVFFCESLKEQRHDHVFVEPDKPFFPARPIAPIILDLFSKNL